MRMLVRNLRQSYQEWQDDDGYVLAAAMAYYTALSFLPVLLILISGFGLFLQFSRLGQDAEKQILDLISDYSSPGLKQQVAWALAQVRDQAPRNGPVGLLTLLVAAISVFAQLEKAFDRIWDVDDRQRRGLIAAVRQALFARLRAFAMLLILGLLLASVFIAGLVLGAIRERSAAFLPIADSVWQLVHVSVSLCLNAAVFTLMYRVLPKAPVQWSKAARGGALAAATWEIGRQVLASFVIGNRYSSAYGVIGSFIAIMLWMYYASLVVFLVAEYVQVISRETSRAEGRAGARASP